MECSSPENWTRKGLWEAALLAKGNQEAPCARRSGSRSTLATYCATGVVELIRRRNESLISHGVLEVFYVLQFALSSEATATEDDPSDSLAKPVTNLSARRLPTLIINRILQ
ncbi:MAG: hypothetical protein WCL39_15270 [Armatimonadota bacterium]